MSSTKMVIIPQENLDAIEEARKELYSMFPDMSIAMQVAMQKVTYPMWVAANTKWEQAK